MSNLTEQSQDLAQAGMPPAQAEAIAKAIHDLVDPLAQKVETITMTLPQLEVLQELRGDIDKLSDNMNKAHIESITAMSDLRNEVRGKVSEMQKGIGDLAVELAEAKGEFRGAKWILAGILLAVTSAAVKYIFFPIG